MREKSSSQKREGKCMEIKCRGLRLDEEEEEEEDKQKKTSRSKREKQEGKYRGGMGVYCGGVFNILMCVYVQVMYVWLVRVQYNVSVLLLVGTTWSVVSTYAYTDCCEVVGCEQC